VTASLQTLFAEYYGRVASLTEEVQYTIDLGGRWAEFNVSADVTNLDLTVQWFPRGGNFVVFGGPGIAMLDSRVNVVFIGVPFTDTDITNIFTVHAGAGYAWQLGNGFFIQPEVRARRYFGAEVKAPSAIEGFRFSYQATDIEAGLTVGWRFGS